MNNFSLALPQFFSLLSMIFIFLLGLFILFKNRQSVIHRLFFLISVVFAIWLFGSFMMFIYSSDDQKIIFWDRFIYLGVAFMPALEYHFSLVFTHSNDKRKKLLIIAYLLSFVFLILSRTDYFVADVFRYRFGVHSQAQLFHHFFLAFFFFYVFALLYNFYQQYTRSVIKIEKHRLKYIIIAFTVLNIIGGIGYLPAYKISIYSPVSLGAPFVFSILIGYTIIRYRLVDARVIVRKVSTYLILTSLFLTPFLLVILFHPDSNQSTIRRHAVYGFLMVFILIMIIPYLYDKLQKFVNNHIYPEIYTTKEALIKFAGKINDSVRIDEIVKLLIENLVSNFGLDRAMVLLHDADYHKYSSFIPEGFNQLNSVSLGCKNPLIKFLKTEKKLVIRDELELLIRDTIDLKKQIALAGIAEEMRRVNTSLCVPLIRRDELVGVIVLGNDISNEPYSQDDIDLLLIIAEQSAIAIENSLLYNHMEQMVAKQTKKIATQNKNLKELLEAKSNFLSIASHQLRTPTSIIRSMLSMALERNVPAEKKEYFIGRAVVGADRLSLTIHDLLSASSMESVGYNFAKKETNIDELILKVINERTVKAQEKKVELVYNPPQKKTPLLRIDDNKIIEAVANLIDNAIQYTLKGKIIIETNFTKDRFYFSIKDQGIGILPEELKKIFNKIYRTPNAISVRPDGTGLGLFLVKKIIEGHKGKVSVASDGVNKGSTFSFWLPIG